MSNGRFKFKFILVCISNTEYHYFSILQKFISSVQFAEYS